MVIVVSEGDGDVLCPIYRIPLNPIATTWHVTFIPKNEQARNCRNLETQDQLIAGALIHV